MDAFFFQQSRSKNQFTVTYGTDCPELLQDIRASKVLSPEDRPMLLVDNGRLGTHHTYFCKHEDHIEKSALKVAQDLVAEAEPWLRRIVTPRDLVEQYRASNAHAFPPGPEVPPGQILRWQMYGLLLDDIGERTAPNWLGPVLSAYEAEAKNLLSTWSGFASSRSA